MTSFFCLPLLLATCAVAQTVEGSVINAVTGNGIAGVTVEIVRASGAVHSTNNDPQAEEEEKIASGGRAAYSAATDVNGRFRIDGVKDGAYTARYDSPGFWYDPRTPGSLELGVGREAEGRATPRPFRVTADGSRVKLEARMIPLGRIASRVIDGRGETVPNARLVLKGPMGTSIGFADAKGEFVFGEQFPGVYTLDAAPPLGWKPPDPEPDGRVLGWARTYYPRAAFPEAASRIALRPGVDLPDIEIELQAVPAHAVRGVLLKPDGAPAPKEAITLGEDAFLPILRVESKPDGTFEFPVVVDGEWRLSAEVSSGAAVLRAAHWMEMAGRELEGVKLRLNAPFTVRGSVVVETPKGQAAPKPPPVTLIHTSRGPNPFEGISLFARPNTDGSFSLDNVYPGTYRLFAADLPAYYLDAVRLDEADLSGPEVELSSGAVSIVLLYKANGGTVRGTVEKCASGGVVLVPQHPAMRPWFTHAARCDPNGRYEIRDVRPGDYYALASPADASSPFWAPRFPNEILNQATSITVRAGEASSADLRAIMLPLY